MTEIHNTYIDLTAEKNLAPSNSTPTINILICNEHFRN